MNKYYFILLHAGGPPLGETTTRATGAGGPDDGRDCAVLDKNECSSVSKVKKKKRGKRRRVKKKIEEEQEGESYIFKRLQLLLIWHPGEQDVSICGGGRFANASA